VDAEAGFLSAQSTEWVRTHRAKYSTLFEECESLNRDANAFLLGLKVGADNQLHITVSTLLGRCLEFYQAAVLMVEQGIVPASRVILRALVEANFAIVAIDRERDTLRHYIRNDDYWRVRIIEKIWKMSPPVTEVYKDIATPEVRQDLLDALKKEKVIQLTTFELAKRADMLDTFYGLYASLTGPAHAHVRDMQVYLVMDPKGENLESLRIGPSDRDTADLLPIASLLLIQAVGAAASVFGQDVAPLVQKHQTRVVELSQQVGKNAAPSQRNLE